MLCPIVTAFLIQEILCPQSRLHHKGNAREFTLTLQILLVVVSCPHQVPKPSFLQREALNLALTPAGNEGGDFTRLFRNLFNQRQLLALVFISALFQAQVVFDLLVANDNFLLPRPL
jgi:hypothetical protein